MAQRRKTRGSAQGLVDVGVSLTPSQDALEAILERLETSARLRRASQILHYTKSVRSALRESDPVLAALAMYDAVRIEQGVSHGRLAVSHLRRKAEHRKRGAKGGNARAARLAERDAEIRAGARNLRANHPDWSIRRVARELAPQVKLSWKRVAAIIAPGASASGSRAT